MSAAFVMQRFSGLLVASKFSLKPAISLYSNRGLLKIPFKGNSINPQKLAQRNFSRTSKSEPPPVRSDNASSRIPGGTGIILRSAMFTAGVSCNFSKKQSILFSTYLQMYCFILVRNTLLHWSRDSQLWTEKKSESAELVVYQIRTVSKRCKRSYVWSKRHQYEILSTNHLYFLWIKVEWVLEQPFSGQEACRRSHIFQHNGLHSLASTSNATDSWKKFRSIRTIK